MQSTTSKVVLLAVLVVAAVGLFVVLSGDDDDSGSDTTTETTAQQGTNPTTETAPAAPTASITVKGGEPVGGPAEIEVTKGDQVTIQVTSDADGEVHVHGYEIEKPIKAGQTVTVAFEADLDGKYEIEQHFESGGEEIGETEIAELTVQP
jgi:FtsP/CotA-like multicopper oxidase with cupredoxin domain